LKIWDSFEGKCLNTLNGHKDQVRCVLYLKNQDLIVSGSSDKSIKMWSPRDGNNIHTISPAHEGGVRSLSISDSGKLISGG
jgi:WD40 repeat protein